MAPSPSILGLDFGDIRVGLAIATLTARLPRPLATLEFNNVFFDELRSIISQEQVREIVVGLPRGMEGQPTAQTATVQDFAAELKRRLKLPIHFQDEALTSKKAEAELHARGKPYRPTDIDALAATYILDDYLNRL